jgi:hypothetical protein
MANTSLERDVTEELSMAWTAPGVTEVVDHITISS